MTGEEEDLTAAKAARDEEILKASLGRPSEGSQRQEGQKRKGYG